MECDEENGKKNPYSDILFHKILFVVILDMKIGS